MNLDNAFIAEQADSFYGVKLVKENTLGNSGNKIFEVTTGQSQYMLRATEYSPWGKEHLQFELQWMEYLANYIAGIVRPIKSLAGNLCEVIQSGDTSYILCLIEKAPGKTVDSSNPDEFNEELFFQLGALMGDMHRLTMGYAGNVRKPEFEWDGPVTAWRIKNPILDEDVRLALENYNSEISALPIDKSSYGIIHMDIHTDNFFVGNGQIKLFDFDACQFNWYAADMASAIFFMVLKGAGPLTHKSEKECTEFAEAYTISCLKGYLQTNRVDTFWIKKMDLFMKYQMGDEYLCAQSFWPGELAHQRDWYLNWHKERITKGLPYVFMDYEKVINSLPPL